MVDVEMIVAILAFTTYIAYLDAYKVHSRDKKVLNNFIVEYKFFALYTR